MQVNKETFKQTNNYFPPKTCVKNICKCFDSFAEK